MRLLVHDNVQGKTRQLLRDTFFLVARRLGIDGYNRTVQIALRDDLPEKLGGYVRVDNSKKQKFLIIINTKNIKPLMIAALCHELVHVKQFLTGMLDIDDVGKRQLFYGKPCDLPYDEQPWEIEAEREMWPLAGYVCAELAKKGAL